MYIRHKTVPLLGGSTLAVALIWWAHIGLR
jgi:hypothetical protein